MQGQDVRVSDSEMGYMGLYRSIKPYPAGQANIPPSNQAPSSGSRRNHIIVIGPGVGLNETLQSSSKCTGAAVDSVSPKVTSLLTAWPEWKRANDTAEVVKYGGVKACCNDTLLVNETSVTALGGGECAVIM
jgi:hypothetical protein